jgi:tetratricopeptide (TPR) repeat protein
MRFQNLAKYLLIPFRFFSHFPKRAETPSSTTTKRAGNHKKTGLDYLKSMRPDPIAEAIAEFTEAIGLDPTSALAYFKRGWAWYFRGELEKAIDDFTESIRLNPKAANALRYRGKVWGRAGDDDKAIADFTDALRLNPTLDDVYADRGFAWLRKGKADECIADCVEALRLNPNSSHAFKCRARAWRTKGEYDKAIADWTEQIRLDQTFACFGYSERGLAWARKGEFERALADYNEAIRLGPQFQVNWDGRAWLLATCPMSYARNGPAAVEDATQACELSSWKKSWNLTTLSAACAETGDYSKAIDLIKRAVSMDGVSTDDTERNLRGTMLQLFEGQTPYRDEPQKWRSYWCRLTRQ